MSGGYRPQWPGAPGWPNFQWTLPERYNITTQIREAAVPTRTALRHLDRSGAVHTICYEELMASITALSVWCDRQDLERGDRLGICLPQCPESVMLQLAALEKGVIVVPMSMIMGPSGITQLHEAAQPSVIVTDESRVEAVTRTGTKTVEVTPPAGDSVTLSDRLERFDVSYGAEGSIGDEPTTPDTPAYILFTSGTSGAPKGVTLGHRALIGTLPGFHCWFELFDERSVDGARIWSPSEWAWAGALFNVLLPTLSLGGTVVSRERRSGFNPGQALQLVDDEAITHAFLPPTALSKIRAESDVDEYTLHSLDVIQCGGESLSDDLWEWGERTLDVTINEAYGLTEANALVGNCSAWYPRREGMMGKPYPGHNIALSTKDGYMNTAGTVGELCVELPDPVAFLEYWNDPTATEERIIDDWLHTGDVARFDADGYLRHMGRMDDLIITAGYRVSPLEVESALESLDTVEAAVVGGVPDDERGERVKAYILASDGSGDDKQLLESVVADARSILGPHKAPREIELIDDLPETRSGKVDRSSLFG